MPQAPIKMTVKIDDRDIDMARLLEDLDSEFDAVDIGVLASEDELLRLYASANEFGTTDGHIPERSFIRSGVDQNEAEINEVADRLWDQIISGRQTKAQALAKMGETIQRHIQRRITTLRHPPNAPSTVKRKKSSNPLIDTGRMRASIRWVLAKSTDGEGGI